MVKLTSQKKKKAAANRKIYCPKSKSGVSFRKSWATLRSYLASELSQIYLERCPEEVLTGRKIAE